MSQINPFIGSPLFGGSGFGAFGWGWPQTITQQNLEPAPDTVKPVDATDRNFLPPWFTGLVSGGYFTGGEPAPISSPWLYWEMRKDPVINLAYVITTAPVMAGTYTIEIEGDNDQRPQPWKDLAKKMQELATAYLLPIFENSLPAACECLHFGQWLQEVVWDKVDGYTVPIELNTVLPTEAALYCDLQRKFSGFKIGDQFRDTRYAYLSVNLPHIHPVLGYARNENAKVDWWRGLQSNIKGDASERKASGMQIFVSMPIGAGFVGENGKEIFSKDVCQAIVNAAQMSGVTSLPKYAFKMKDIMANPALANVPAVDVKQIDWGDMSGIINAQIARLERGDRNKMRAWNRPEREAMESQHGSKADSNSAGDIGVIDCEQVGRARAQQFTKQPLEVWRVTNFGKDSPKLYVKMAPLNDPQQEFLQKVTNALIADRITGPATQSNIDQRKLLGDVEVPLVSEEDAAEALAKQQAAMPSPAQSGQQQPNSQQTAPQGQQQATAANGNGNGHTNGKTPQLASGGKWTSDYRKKQLGIE